MGLKILKVGLRILLGTIFFTFIFLLIFSHFYRKEHEKLEVQLGYDEVVFITKNWSSISEELYKIRVFETLVDFMQGENIEYVKKKQSAIAYTLEDLGFHNPTRCNIYFNLTESEEIICNFKSQAKVSGDLIFTKNKDNSWACKYTGDSEYLPENCKDNLPQKISQVIDQK